MEKHKKIKELVQRALNFYDILIEHLSTSTREHANRRTIIAMIAVGISLTWLYLFVLRPPDNFPINNLVAIEEGLSLDEVAVLLKAKEVIRSPIALRVLVTLMGHEHDVHFGDYLFKEPRDLLSIARAISQGAYGLEPVRIRIPEGATTKEMALIYAAQLLRFNRETFLAEATPMEGYLFPDTYFFLPNATEELVIRTMRQNFNDKISAIQDKLDEFGKPLSDVVTMASLLEREARKMEDRKKISGVLWNRLNRGMLLQVDAAFLYTLGKGTYQLTTKDLQSDSPYNTYRNKGLPPGPIGSPSLSSIEAAVTPVKHKYIFYLADRSGVTHYAVTYAEHLRNKSRYIY